MIARIWLVALVALGIEVICQPLAGADVARFAVVIGNDVGGRGEPKLSFAESDAAKMAEVIAEVGGYPPENVTVLRGADAATATNTLIAVNDRIRSRATQGDGQAVLFVYYSGHADRQALHLGDSRLALSVLEELVRGSAADLRLLIVDACQSGALTRVKGGRSAAPLACLAPPDANQDGVIVLKEAYRYAYDRTIRATSLTQAGIQHPTFRYEVGGRGDFVLAHLRLDASHRSVVQFPPGRYLMMRTDRNGPVMVEVAEQDTARTVTVKAGAYFVRARGSDYLLERPALYGSLSLGIYL